jgi:hypothetical protein
MYSHSIKQNVQWTYTISTDCSTNYAQGELNRGNCMKAKWNYQDQVH